jgi:hypothetical protein
LEKDYPNLNPKTQERTDETQPKPNTRLAKHVGSVQRLEMDIPFEQPPKKRGDKNGGWNDQKGRYVFHFVLF